MSNSGGKSANKHIHLEKWKKNISKTNDFLLWFVRSYTRNPDNNLRASQVYGYEIYYKYYKFRNQHHNHHPPP